jgi:hypothetical protein
VGVAVPFLAKMNGKDFELLTEVIVGKPDNVNKALFKLVQDTK